MTATATFDVSVMHCGACIGRVEQALNALPGVIRTVANLATCKVTVDYEQPTDITVLTVALAAAGYPADSEIAVLDIEGMHCASCVGRVEAALLNDPGVCEAHVNLAAQTVRLRYFASLTSLEKMIAAIALAGYQAEIRSSDTSDRAAKRNAEIAGLWRVTLLAAILALPVFLVEMGGHLFPGLHHWIGQTIGHQTSRLVQFVLTSLVLFGPGRRFYVAGFPALLRGRPDMNALVALGTSAAYGYSVIATFAPALLPAASRNVYFEAAAVIVVLVLAGRLMEVRAKGRTGSAIRKLVGLRSRTARVRRESGDLDILTERVVTGDIVHVRPGEKIATDGIVLEGQTYIDEAMISGEPIPVGKAPGDMVTGGTINGTGAISFRATAVGQDTVLAQIVRIVEEAQVAKLPIQALVDKITLRFVPAVLAIAALTVVIWLIVTSAPANALVAGVSVLIIACPCAMGLATPTSIMLATGRGAELGVLFHKGDALQRLQDARVVAFDKTGTLTIGRPDISDFHLVDGFAANYVLRAVASLEILSEHPLATAMVRAARAQGAEPAKIEGFQSVTGLGLRGQLDGSYVQIGSAQMMSEAAIDVANYRKLSDDLAGQGKTVVFVAIDDRLATMIGISDRVKPNTAAALDVLRQSGIELAMITGDAEKTARAIAAELGINHVVAGVRRPDGKIDALRALRSYGPVAFVGDGINDAPALAEADIGIAVGRGTDVAVEAADVVLVSNQLTGVANAFAISRATMRNIRQNLGWAFGYNLLLIPVAAGVLYPSFGLMLSPMLAAGAMAFSSVAVLLNALRLRKFDPPSNEWDLPSYELHAAESVPSIPAN